MYIIIIKYDMHDCTNSGCVNVYNNYYSSIFKLTLQDDVLCVSPASDILIRTGFLHHRNILSPVM